MTTEDNVIKYVYLKKYKISLKLFFGALLYMSSYNSSL